MELEEPEAAPMETGSLLGVQAVVAEHLPSLKQEAPHESWSDPHCGWAP